jgi:hypothetical protein
MGSPGVNWTEAVTLRAAAARTTSGSADWRRPVFAFPVPRGPRPRPFTSSPAQLVTPTCNSLHIKNLASVGAYTI